MDLGWISVQPSVASSCLDMFGSSDSARLWPNDETLAGHASIYIYFMQSGYVPWLEAGESWLIGLDIRQ